MERHLSSYLAGLICLAGCVAPRTSIESQNQTNASNIQVVGPSPTPTPSRRSSRIGKIILRKLKSQITLQSDVALGRFLKNMVKRLSGRDVEILLYDNKRDSPFSNWRSFSFEDGIIILPRRAFVTLSTESEWAAIVALEVARLKLSFQEERFRAVESTLGSIGLESLDLSDLFSATGWLTSAGPEDFESLNEAVGLLYQGGFDPRGMVALFTQYQAQLKSRSPWGEAELLELEQRARKAVVNYPPLLNPVVRSVEFLRLKEKMSSQRSPKNE